MTHNSQFSSKSIQTAPANFEQKFVVIQAKLGDSIRLECNATGDQPLTIDWFREGNNSTIEKHGNELYDIHESSPVGDFGLSSFMHIRAIKGDDGLLYKCLARNEFGSSERLIKLIVLGVPERPTQLRVRDVWSRSALVTWMSQYPASGGQPGAGAGTRVSNYTVQYWRKNPASSPAANQQNHRREETLVDGLHSSALLVNLLPAITYEVSVIAHNQVGHSEPSEPINVTTSEEEPSAPPTDVMVESRGSASLRVSWKLPPSESLNGKLQGFYIGYRPRYPLATLHHLSAVPGSPASVVSNQQVQVQQQQQQQQSLIYSFKTADAVENQLYYDTFLTNLKHNQDYEITVRAFNKAGSGPDCHTIVGRTSSARLPAAPSLQVQRVTTNSVTLRWSSTVTLAPPRIGGATGPVLDILRYILYYQLQGEREWYELTVARSLPEHELGGDSSNQLSKPLIEGGSAELITSQASLHTLSNLQPGVAYRIYVAAANDYGIGDPSNVVSVKTDPALNATSSPAFLGAALLDSAGANLFESWSQQQHDLLYTVLSSAAIMVILLLLIAFLVWQHKTRSKYNSSSASSYPSSWTPAASDTIQSEYSVKRFPVSSAVAAANANALADVYDEVPSSRPSGRNLSANQHSFGSTTTGGSRAAMQQLLRNSSTATRPILSPHYHQPADLISGSGTLQLHSGFASGNTGTGMNQRQTQQQQRKTSSTLNRNQNRQLPPIPYSTLTVKEISGAEGSGKQSQWRQQQSSGSEYRLCNQQQQQQQLVHQNNLHKQHQLHQSTGGSQTPLIYGVIE